MCAKYCVKVILNSGRGIKAQDDGVQFDPFILLALEDVYYFPAFVGDDVSEELCPKQFFSSTTLR